MAHAQTTTDLSYNIETGIENLPSLPRFLRGLRALARLARNPNDTQLALTAAIWLNAGSLPRLRAKFEADPSGRELLATQPALDVEHVDLAALSALPVGTVGRTYSEFMRARGLTPEVFVAPREVRDERARYIAQRMRQTHDLWHVVTGYDTDVLGEIELQAFTYGQTRMPFSLLVGALGLVRAAQPATLVLRRAWGAYRRGRSAKALYVRAWERDFAELLHDMQQRLGLAA